MSLGGTYQDFYKDMFKDVLMHESQQMGSVLSAICKSEMMEGNKTFFQKLGSVSAVQKGSRGAPKVPADVTFERRQVQETFYEYSHNFDKEDLIKYIKDPKSEVTQAAIMALGRYKDEIIMDAIKGNAVVTNNGSASNQALTLSVAVDNHTFDDGSGNVALTTGKLKKAKSLIMENYGMVAGQRLICIAPSSQIMHLTKETQQVSGDFRSKKPLESPGLVDGISGFMGIDFVAYEDTGVDGSSNELVYLLTEDAIKLGIFSPLKVSVHEDFSKMGNPDLLTVNEAIGAARMYETKVVEIACTAL